MVRDPITASCFRVSRATSSTKSLEHGAYTISRTDWLLSTSYTDLLWKVLVGALPDPFGTPCVDKMELVVGVSSVSGLFGLLEFGVRCLWTSDTFSRFVDRPCVDFARRLDRKCVEEQGSKVRRVGMKMPWVAWRKEPLRDAVREVPLVSND